MRESSSTTSTEKAFDFGELQLLFSNTELFCIFRFLKCENIWLIQNQVHCFDWKCLLRYMLLLHRCLGLYNPTKKYFGMQNPTKSRISKSSNTAINTIISFSKMQQNF